MNTGGEDGDGITNIEFTIFFNCRPLLVILFFLLLSSGTTAASINSFTFPSLRFPGSSIRPSGDGRSRRNWLTTTTKHRDAYHLLRKYSTVNFNAIHARLQQYAGHTRFFVRSGYFISNMPTAWTVARLYGMYWTGMYWIHDYNFNQWFLLKS